MLRHCPKAICEASSKVSWWGLAWNPVALAMTWGGIQLCALCTLTCTFQLEVLLSLLNYQWIADTTSEATWASHEQLLSTFEGCFDTVLNIWRATTNNLYQQFLRVQYPYLISGSEGQLPATAGLILAPHILGGAWKLKHQVRWDSWKMEFATTTTTTKKTYPDLLGKGWLSLQKRSV